MSVVELVVLAVGLAMDATAVAGTRGVAVTKIQLRGALLVALFFGGAQAAMPALGWALGEALASRIARWGHWVTFVVLGAIGAKMIHEAWGSKANVETGAEKALTDPFGVRVLAALAVATSIDALAAGVTLALRNANIVLSCLVIGLVTAVLSFGGVYAGHRFGTRLGKRFDAVGGLALIALAVKALVDR
jgi:putative Mn2+ efflux pump MntP